MRINRIYSNAVLSLRLCNSSGVFKRFVSRTSVINEILTVEKEKEEQARLFRRGKRKTRTFTATTIRVSSSVENQNEFSRYRSVPETCTVHVCATGQTLRPGELVVCIIYRRPSKSHSFFQLKFEIVRYGVSNAMHSSQSRLLHQQTEKLTFSDGQRGTSPRAAQNPTVYGREVGGTPEAVRLKSSQSVPVYRIITGVYNRTAPGATGARAFRGRDGGSARTARA